MSVIQLMHQLARVVHEPHCVTSQYPALSQSGDSGDSTGMEANVLIAQAIKKNSERLGIVGRKKACPGNFGLGKAGEQGKDGCGDRDAETLGCPTLWAGEGHRVVFEVNAVHRDRGFGKSASGGESNFKRNRHPRSAIWKAFTNLFYLLVGQRWFYFSWTRPHYKIVHWPNCHFP